LKGLAEVDFCKPFVFGFKSNVCAFLRNCFLLKILGGEEGF